MTEQDKEEGEKEYREVIYWRTLVKKITTIPEKKRIPRMSFQ